MRAVLVSGLWPTSKSSSFIEGSLFEKTYGPHARRVLERAGLPGFTLQDLVLDAGDGKQPLLRPGLDAPHLTTCTLESIIRACDWDCVHVPIGGLADGQPAAPDGRYDVVLVSTTYLWNMRMVDTVLRWVIDTLPGLPIFLGGQYTNLKYQSVMLRQPEVCGVVRGDGEAAIAALLRSIRQGGELSSVPNLVWRDGEAIRTNPVTYLDLNEWPSPTMPPGFRVAPYESMRGCPFDCKFCSFPAASPEWRYKSASKIVDDWVRYAEGGVQTVEAMDSTFTVPPTRMRELFELLPAAKVPWECFSRANVLTSVQFVERMVEAHCQQVYVGYESMNEATLKGMSKRVTAAQNRRSLDVMRATGLGYSVCFMVGYPGETPEQFNDTRTFLTEEFSGHFQLHLFGLSDETMPLWADREALQIRVEDPEDSDAAWSHIGMTSDEARRLQRSTVQEIRRNNDDAVQLYWQGAYREPFLPHAGTADNLAMEKAVERLAMAPVDHPDENAGAAQIHRQLELLARQGISVGS